MVCMTVLLSDYSRQWKGRITVKLYPPLLGNWCMQKAMSESHVLLISQISHVLYFYVMLC
jgi:hypothetical protein